MQPQQPNANGQGATTTPVTPPAPVVPTGGVSVGPAPAPAPVQAQAPASQQVSAPQPQSPATSSAPAQEEIYEDDEEFDDDAVDLSQPVNWQAKEFIHQEKSSLWFIIFGVVFVVFMAIAIFLMNSLTFAALLVVIAVVIVVLAKRPPRLMSYSLSEKGLHIGDTLHSFSDFRAFGIIHDGEEYSVMLIPTKRFLPGVTVYFPEESGEEIVDALGSRLPMQDLRLDIIDRVVRKLRLG